MTDYRDDPRLAPLLGADGPFAVRDVVLDGVPLREFVHAPGTLLDLFAMGDAHADRTHLVHEDERCSFGDVWREARSLARALREELGVGAGQRIAIAMRNRPEFVVCFWGAVLAGAIVVPLNAWWSGPELRYALEDADARVAFVDDERLERLRAEDLPAGVRLIGVPADEGDGTYGSSVAGPAIEDGALARPGPDDVVTVLYTSGTTGRPKGSIGTHRAVIANIWNMAFGLAREALLAARPPSPLPMVTLLNAPLFHVGGIASICSAPLSGAKLVMMRKWDVEDGIRLAREEQVTNFGGVPASVRQLLERPDVDRVGLALRTIPLGGGPAPLDLPTRARTLFGDDVVIWNGYGLTETMSAVVMNVGAEYAERPASVGRPCLTTDVRVLGPHGEVRAAGGVGELAVRSPQVARGYWNDEEATRAAFVGGWFRTGDVGHLDADGFVYVVDRLKAVIVRGGENVYCAEVEAVLEQHPAVAEVAVFGVLEHSLGERVAAAVVPRGDGVITLSELRAFAADRLAAYKLPEAIAVVTELPVTATGKVAKRVLRERFTELPNEDRLW